MNKKDIKYLVILVFTGIILWAYFFVFETVSTQEFWVAWLLNVSFFIMISLFGYLFLSFHILAKTKWHLPVQNYLLQTGRLTILAGILFLPLFWGMKSIFPWIGNLELFETKGWYLNVSFFRIRTIIILLCWLVPGFFIAKRIQKSKAGKIDFVAGIITVLYIFSFIIFSHDWLLTLCCEWNSTLFGWFILSGLLATGMAFVSIYALLSEKVNAETIVDLSKYLFTFSCIWMYLWYSQFVLIWYTNIQHETFYLARQYYNFRPLFYINLVLSFGIPFILLLCKFQKRSPVLLGISSVSVLIGQWINLYLTIYPAVFSEYKSSIFPVAMFSIFLLLFLIPLFIKSKLKRKSKVLFILLPVLIFTSCNPSRKHPGYEYFPSMTYSKSFETYSVNPNFTDSATMRNPVPGTVPREFIPFQYTKTNEDRLLAGQNLKNPVDSTKENIVQGKFLYESFCLHCHGEIGDGMGKLYTEKFYMYKPGVLNGEKIQTAPEGEIFHAISEGFNLMGAHKTILLPEERWKIVRYIQILN